MAAVCMPGSVSFIPAEKHSGGGSHFELLLGLLLGIFFAPLILYLLWRLWSAVRAENEKLKFKDVAVQGPVTYAWNRSDPRYVPLAEHAWGAW